MNIQVNTQVRRRDFSKGGGGYLYGCISHEHPAGIQKIILIKGRDGCFRYQLIAHFPG